MATRLERGLQILRLLRSATDYDVARLAAELGVTRRTIFRDIALLRGLDYPIAFDQESGCYTLSTSDDNANRDAIDPPGSDERLTDRPPVLRLVSDETSCDEAAWLPQTIDFLCQAIRGDRVVRALGFDRSLIEFVPTTLTFSKNRWRVAGTSLDSQPVSIPLCEINHLELKSLDSSTSRHQLPTKSAVHIELKNRETKD